LALEALADSVRRRLFGESLATDAFAELGGD
jgi:hypothetical protein